LPEETYSPEVRLLLVNESEETVDMLYNDNPFTWEMPLIGPRPPYYANPRYDQYYPVL
jgi:hypothetical protein